jgi:hypothetical protein
VGATFYLWSVNQASVIAPLTQATTYLATAPKANRKKLAAQPKDDAR